MTNGVLKDTLSIETGLYPSAIVFSASDTVNMFGITHTHDTIWFIRVSIHINNSLNR